MPDNHSPSLGRSCRVERLCKAQPNMGAEQGTGLFPSPLSVPQKTSLHINQPYKTVKNSSARFTRANTVHIEGTFVSIRYLIFSLYHFHKQPQETPNKALSSTTKDYKRLTSLETNQLTKRNHSWRFKGFEPRQYFSRIIH